jgi:hypothetical protein
VAARSGGQVALRLLIAHALAYPVALAWAFGSVPLIVVAVASASGTSLADAEIAHRVLVRVVWPAVLSFAAVHAAGATWAWSADARRGWRLFAWSSGALMAIAVVAGGVSWLWLMNK